MNDIMIQSAISNPEWAARMLVEQFSKIPASAGVPPASLFLNDTYALGHASVSYTHLTLPTTPYV